MVTAPRRDCPSQSADGGRMCFLLGWSDNDSLDGPLSVYTIGYLKTEHGL